MKKNDHSAIHAGKVALLCAVLARRLDLNQAETLELMLAAVVHDLGRIHNGNDAAHGSRSMMLALAAGVQLPYIATSIVAEHSRADRKNQSHLLNVFKDADALDRVRTGDLDERFLRNKEARELIPFSKELNECLSKAIE